MLKCKIHTRHFENATGEIVDLVVDDSGINFKVNLGHGLF
jgi:hypothetical protein